MGPNTVKILITDTGADKICITNKIFNCTGTVQIIKLNNLLNNKYGHGYGMGTPQKSCESCLNKT